MNKRLTSKPASKLAPRLTTIAISKEDIKFSCAHFTIFSATERERLHGHNYHVRAKLVAPVDDNGMCFNYQEIKTRLRAVCAELDEYMLLPEHSPYLSIRHDGDTIIAEHNGTQLQFPASDTQILPIANTTVEEFSALILNRLLDDDQFFSGNAVQSLEVAVSSGEGQSGSASWAAN